MNQLKRKQNNYQSEQKFRQLKKNKYDLFDLIKWQGINLLGKINTTFLKGSLQSQEIGQLKRIDDNIFQFYVIQSEIDTMKLQQIRDQNLSFEKRREQLAQYEMILNSTRLKYVQPPLLIGQLNQNEMRIADGARSVNNVQEGIMAIQVEENGNSVRKIMQNLDGLQNDSNLNDQLVRKLLQNSSFKFLLTINEKNLNDSLDFYQQKKLSLNQISEQMTDLRQTSQILDQSTLPQNSIQDVNEKINLLIKDNETLNNQFSKYSDFQHELQLFQKNYEVDKQKIAELTSTQNMTSLQTEQALHSISTISQNQITAQMVQDIVDKKNVMVSEEDKQSIQTAIGQNLMKEVDGTYKMEFNKRCIEMQDKIMKAVDVEHYNKQKEEIQKQIKTTNEQIENIHKLKENIEKMGSDNIQEIKQYVKGTSVDLNTQLKKDIAIMDNKQKVFITQHQEKMEKINTGLRNQELLRIDQNFAIDEITQQYLSEILTRSTTYKNQIEHFVGQHISKNGSNVVPIIQAITQDFYADLQDKNKFSQFKSIWSGMQEFTSQFLDDKGKIQFGKLKQYDNALSQTLPLELNNAFGKYKTNLRYQNDSPDLFSENFKNTQFQMPKLQLVQTQDQANTIIDQYNKSQQIQKQITEQIDALGQLKAKFETNSQSMTDQQRSGNTFQLQTQEKLLLLEQKTKKEAIMSEIQTELVEQVNVAFVGNERIATLTNELKKTNQQQIKAQESNDKIMNDLKIQQQSLDETIDLNRQAITEKVQDIEKLVGENVLDAQTRETIKKFDPTQIQQMQKMISGIETSVLQVRDEATKIEDEQGEFKKMIHGQISENKESVKEELAKVKELITTDLKLTQESVINAEIQKVIQKKQIVDNHQLKTEINKTQTLLAKEIDDKTEQQTQQFVQGNENLSNKLKTLKSETKQTFVQIATGVNEGLLETYKVIQTEFQGSNEQQTEKINQVIKKEVKFVQDMVSEVDEKTIAIAKMEREKSRQIKQEMSRQKKASSTNMLNLEKKQEQSIQKIKEVTDNISNELSVQKVSTRRAIGKQQKRQLKAVNTVKSKIAGLGNQQKALQTDINEIQNMREIDNEKIEGNIKELNSEIIAINQVTEQQQTSMQSMQNEYNEQKLKIENFVTKTTEQLDKTSTDLGKQFLAVQTQIEIQQEVSRLQSQNIADTLTQQSIERNNEIIQEQESKIQESGKDYIEKLGYVIDLNNSAKDQNPSEEDKLNIEGNNEILLTRVQEVIDGILNQKISHAFFIASADQILIPATGAFTSTTDCINEFGSLDPEDPKYLDRLEEKVYNAAFTLGGFTKKDDDYKRIVQVINKYMFTHCLTSGLLAIAPEVKEYYEQIVLYDPQQNKDPQNLLTEKYNAYIQNKIANTDWILEQNKDQPLFFGLVYSQGIYWYLFFHLARLGKNQALHPNNEAYKYQFEILLPDFKKVYEYFDSFKKHFDPLIQEWLRLVITTDTFSSEWGWDHILANQLYPYFEKLPQQQFQINLNRLMQQHLQNNINNKIVTFLLMTFYKQFLRSENWSITVSIIFGASIKAIQFQSDDKANFIEQINDEQTLERKLKTFKILLQPQIFNLLKDGIEEDILELKQYNLWKKQGKSNTMFFNPHNLMQLLHFQFDFNDWALNLVQEMQVTFMLKAQLPGVIQNALQQKIDMQQYQLKLENRAAKIARFGSKFKEEVGSQIDSLREMNRETRVRIDEINILSKENEQDQQQLQEQAEEIKNNL